MKIWSVRMNFVRSVWAVFKMMRAVSDGRLWHQCLWTSPSIHVLMREQFTGQRWRCPHRRVEACAAYTTICFISLILPLLWDGSGFQEGGYQVMPFDIFIWAILVSFSVDPLRLLTKNWSLCRSGKRQKEECDYTTARGFPASFLACSSSDRHFHYFSWPPSLWLPCFVFSC